MDARSRYVKIDIAFNSLYTLLGFPFFIKIKYVFYKEMFPLKLYLGK